MRIVNSPFASAYTLEPENEITLTVSRSKVNIESCEGIHRGDDEIVFAVDPVFEDEDLRKKCKGLHVEISMQEAKNLITVLQSLVSLPF